MVLIHIELAPYHLSQLLFCQSNRRRPVHCVQRSSVATAWLWRTGQRTVSSLGSLARGGQLRQRTFRHGVCYTLYQTNKKVLSVTGKTIWPLTSSLLCPVRGFEDPQLVLCCTARQQIVSTKERVKLGVSRPVRGASPTTTCLQGRSWLWCRGNYLDRENTLQIKSRDFSQIFLSIAACQSPSWDWSSFFPLHVLRRIKQVGGRGRGRLA